MENEQKKHCFVLKKSEAAKKRNELLKRIGLWGGSILVLAGLVWGLAKLASSGQTTAPSNLTVPVSQDDHKTGNLSSKIVLVEYSDFQCPACYEFYPVVKSVMDKYGKDIMLVYRHFPLPQHDKSDLAARASEAAGEQGKFWEMYDKLFENQPNWENQSLSQAEQTFTDYAVSLGLNKDAFLAALKADRTEQHVQSEMKSGEDSSVDQTPTFFLNGSKLTNIQSYGDLEADVAGAISASK